MINWYDFMVVDQRRRDERAAADAHRRAKALSPPRPRRVTRWLALLGRGLVYVGRRLERRLESAPATAVRAVANGPRVTPPGSDPCPC